MWRLGLALAFASLLGATALAEEGCSIFPDMFDEYSLGRIPIGAKAQNYISKENLKTCMEFPDEMNEGECHYVDEDGIDYIIWYNAIEKPETARIMYAGEDGTSPARPLIAGLKLGDPLDVVYRKLNSLPDHLPKWQLEENKYGEFWLNTGPCWRSSNGAIWKYDLRFDDAGKLEGVSAWHSKFEIHS
jgi:hypothetical protein